MTGGEQSSMGGGSVSKVTRSKVTLDTEEQGCICCEETGDNVSWLLINIQTKVSLGISWSNVIHAFQPCYGSILFIYILYIEPYFI